MTGAKTVVVVALALGVFGSVHAQSCVPREYAQYKDDVKNAYGRAHVAMGYCQSKRTRDSGLVTPAQAQQCSAEMGKAIDALNSVRATSTVSFALDGCAGEVPIK